MVKPNFFAYFVFSLNPFLFSAYSNKNNFNSIHRTKEAETKVNELYCFSCDMMMMSDGDDCLNINQTKNKQQNLTKKCSQDEIFCSVKRFSYTMSDKNSTSEKKLWSLQRNCSEKCENSCIIIGERVKIHACETCCQNNLCNVGSNSVKIFQYTHKNRILISFFTLVFLLRCQM